MKKILAIASYNYLPWYSGGQKSIAQFLEYLGKTSDLTVVTVNENDFSLVTSYRPVPILKTKSRKRYTDLSLVGKMTKLTRKEGFEAVLWEHTYFAWLAYILKKRTRIKTVFRAHNLEFSRFQSNGKWWWWILKIYERWAFRLADYIFFVSSEDMEYVIRNWNIEPGKCYNLPFGVDVQQPPADKMTAKEVVRKKHQIPANEKIFLFNGLLDYKPNLDALNDILRHINPLLLQQKDILYKIIICGKRLPAEYNNLDEYKDKNIIFAGFVDDIETYFKAADIFLNPVQSGGGIKTKMVESIAYNSTVISTETGAAGINRGVCGNKLIVVADNDWQAFSRAVLQHVNDTSVTPKEYYDHYFYGNIIREALLNIDKKSPA